MRGRRRAARRPRGRGGRRRCPRLRCLKEAEVGGRTVLEEEELPSLVVAAVPGMALGLGRRNWPEEEEEEEVGEAPRQLSAGFRKDFRRQMLLLLLPPRRGPPGSRQKCLKSGGRQTFRALEEEEEEEEEEEALLADVEVRREGCRSIDR